MKGRPATARRLALPRAITARPLAAIIAAGVALRLALTPLYAHLPNGLLTYRTVY